MDVFDYLSIPAVIGNIVCVHGGLSPLVSCLDDIRKIKKDNCKIALDLLWSDSGE